MKLTAAKCPNCGANLDVDPKVETMKCQYCKSAILVEDAISKYKLEISGEIEINNFPKLKDILSSAQRSYNNKNFEEAYKYYGKAKELDPDNKALLLRYDICKAMVNNYADYSLQNLYDSFKELLEDDSITDENKNQYVDEVIYAIDESLYATRRYYNKYALNQQEVEYVQAKLFSVYLFYELIINYTGGSNTKAIEQIISVLKDVLKDKMYKTGTSREGGNYLKEYKTDLGSKSTLKERLRYYEALLNLDGDVSSVPNYITENNRKKINNIEKIAIGTFIGLLMVGASGNGQFVSAIVLMFIGSILLFNKLDSLLFKDNKKIKIYVLIGLFILLIITIGSKI